MEMGSDPLELMPQQLPSLGNNFQCLRGIESIVENSTDISHGSLELRSP